MFLEPVELAFASFAGVKFVGYTAAAWALNRSYRTRKSGIWKVGAARTILGLAAGAMYGGLFLWLFGSTHPLRSSDFDGYVLYFGGLIPVRLAEWSLVIWYFYQRGSPNRTLLLRNSAAGMVWSFVLDAVGIFALSAVPGGRWIC